MKFLKRHGIQILTWTICAVVLVGCVMFVRSKIIQDNERERTEIAKELNHLFSVNSEAEAYIKEFSPTEQFPLLFQDEMRGPQGKMEGNFSGGFLTGPTGSIKSETSMAQNCLLWWQDRKGIIHPTVAKTVQFIPTEGKPARVLFHLNLVAPIGAKEIEANYRRVRGDYLSKMRYIEELEGIRNAWKLSDENAGAFLDKYLSLATVTASRADLKKHYHVIVP